MNKYEEENKNSNEKNLFSIETEKYKYLLEKIQFNQIQFDENIYENKFFDRIDSSDKFLLEENEYKIYKRMNLYYKEKYLEEYYKNIIIQCKDIKFSSKNHDNKEEKEDVKLKLSNKKIKVNVLYDKSMYYYCKDPMVFAVTISLLEKDFHENTLDEKTKELYKSILKSKMNDYLDKTYIEYLENNNFKGRIINDENDELFNDSKFEILCINTLIKKIYENKFLQQFSCRFFKFLEKKYPYP
jgi:hypothetical protein